MSSMESQFSEHRCMKMPKTPQQLSLFKAAEVIIKSEPPSPNPLSPHSSSPSPITPCTPISIRPHLIHQEFELIGNPPTVFTGRQDKAERFLCNVQLFQQINLYHPIMHDPCRRITWTLSMIQGEDVEEWKQGKVEWIMTTPILWPPFLSLWNKFEHNFLEDWKDSLAPKKAVQALLELRMKGDQVDEYISWFFTLTKNAGYCLDLKAVLDLFHKGLTWSLWQACMQFDQLMTWEAWTASARNRQSILTILDADKPEGDKCTTTS